MPDIIIQDGRYCTSHPTVRISSPDGMFDAECYLCESDEDAPPSRNEAAARIRRALRARSGRPWSVTVGRGTSWGWIRIDAPPSRRTWHSVLREGAELRRPEDYTEADTGQPGGCMSPADRAELGRLLGMPGPVHFQGVGIPAAPDYYTEYIDRAEGRPPSVVGVPYWD